MDDIYWLPKALAVGFILAQVIILAFIVFVMLLDYIKTISNRSD